MHQVYTTLAGFWVILIYIFYVDGLLLLLLAILLGDGVLSIISTALFKSLWADESALVIVSRGWSGNIMIKALVCSGEGGSSSDPATSLPVIVSKYS